MLEISIHYDGGNRCNIPGRYGVAYGSYSINGSGAKWVNHEVRVSNNAAEILTALVAIESLQCDPAKTHLILISDSKISLGAATKKKKAKFKNKTSSPEFLSAASSLYILCQKFGKLTTRWVPRAESVAAFGH